MFPGRYPAVPDNMWTWNPQTMGLQSQFCGGDLMNQQSQAQSQAQTQAQLAALREQNTILNQQLASQAQSHIQHLQQLLPFHQSTFNPHPAQPTPTVPEPPTPVAPQSTPPGSSVSFNAEEMMQQMKNTVGSSMQAFVDKNQERHMNQPPTPVQPPIQATPPIPSHPPPPDEVPLPPQHHSSSLSLSLPPTPWGPGQTSNLYSTQSSSSQITQTNTSLLSATLLTQKTTFDFEGSIQTSQQGYICHPAFSFATST